MSKYVVKQAFFAGRLYEAGTQVQFDEKFAKSVKEYIEPVYEPGESVPDEAAESEPVKEEKAAESEPVKEEKAEKAKSDTRTVIRKKK